MKTRFPNPVLNRMKRLKKSFSGLFLCDPFPDKDKVYDDWEYHDQKSINEMLMTSVGKRGKIMLKENPVSVTFFPNFMGICSLKGTKSSLSVTVPIIQESAGQKMELYFLDEYNRSDIRIKTLLSVPIFIYVGVVNKEFAVIYSMRKLDESGRYWIKALRIPFVNVIDGDKIITYRYLLIKERVFHEDLNDVKNLKFDSIDDFCLVWDFDKDIPVYDSIETFIILSSCVFFKPSYPAINLILCGETGTKKTAWFDTFKEIFGDDYALSQWSSIKGLIVSHFGERAQAGILFKASFVSMIDEFFRRFLSDTRSVAKGGATMVLRNGLSDFMNIVEHKLFPFASGKGSIDLQLKTSFMATDNVIYKSSIPMLWSKDKAVLKRFSWLLVSEDTARKAQMMRFMDVDDAIALLLKRWKKNKIFNSKGQYERFCKWARLKILDSMITSEEQHHVDSLILEVEKKYGVSFFIATPAKALFLCWKFFSKHIKNMNLDFYDKAFWRLADDAKIILEPKGFREVIENAE